MGFFNSKATCIYCNKELVINIEIDNGYHLECFYKNEYKKSSEYEKVNLVQNDASILAKLEIFLEKKIPVSKKRMVNITARSKREIFSPGYYLENGRVTVLFLDGFNAEFLPEIICGLKHLIYLKLVNSNFHFLPSNLGNLKNLEIFHVINCPISFLPPSIGKLLKLKEIILQKNVINYLPKEIGALKSLKTLTLNENNITIFPEEIGNLTSLKALILDENKLSVLPEQLKHLNLKYLSLVDNPIIFLPDWIIEMKYLKILTLPWFTKTSEQVRSGLEKNNCKIRQAIKKEQKKQQNSFTKKDYKCEIHTILKLMAIWDKLTLKETQKITDIDKNTINYIINKLISYKILIKTKEGYFNFSNEKFSQDLKLSYVHDSYNRMTSNLSSIYESIGNDDIFKAYECYKSMILFYEPILLELESNLMFFLFHYFWDLIIQGKLSEYE